MRQWYRIEAKADEPVAEFFIFGDIGKSYWDDDAVGAKQFVDDLRALPDSIVKARVRVNSFGGDVFDAVAIANALRRWAASSEGRTVETVVEGIAASAASIVIMAGSVISIGDNAMVMVHHPLTVVWGNAKQMRKMADDLDKIAGSIIATYKWHSSMDDTALLALMEAETWMDADEAIANGFATNKIEGLKVAARLESRAMASLAVPEKFRERVKALMPPPTTPPVAASAVDVLRACREGGVMDLAEELLGSSAPLAAVTARVAAEKESRRVAAVRATEITALCTAAKSPELAQGYINGAMPVADVRAHLTILTAKMDRGEIDGGLAPNHRGTSRATNSLVPADVYAERNRPTKES